MFLFHQCFPISLFPPPLKINKNVFKSPLPKATPPDCPLQLGREKSYREGYLTGLLPPSPLTLSTHVLFQRSQVWG